MIENTLFRDFQTSVEVHFNLGIGELSYCLQKLGQGNPLEIQPAFNSGDWWMCVISPVVLSIARNKCLRPQGQDV
jgi:hypothetical protein